MISIPIHSLALRLVLLLMWVGVVGWLGWTLTRAAIGDSLSTFAVRNPTLSHEARLQGVDSAVIYSPRDPLVHWQRGGVYLTVAAEEQPETLLPQAVTELRTATQLSPEDYRLWLTLGRALDRSGAPEEAHAAFTRAAQLAPKHFETQWGLGNHLLRTGDREAAFAALRAALHTRPAARPLIFDYAWNAYAGDSHAVVNALAETAAGRSQFAPLLVARNRVTEALALWRESSAHTPAETQGLIQALVSAGHFKAAYGLWQAAKETGWPQPDAGSLLANGGFEQNFDPATTLPLLAWRVHAGAGVGTTLDQQTRAEGQLSLRFRFEQTENQGLILATQTAPVQPNISYCLSFSAKTEELQSLSTPLIGVYDAAVEQRLRLTSPPLPNGTKDWQETVLRFTTKAETEAVTVRVQRLPCQEPPCPLTGRLWLDSFKLTECAK